MFYRGELPFVRLLVPLIAGIVLTYLFPSNIITESWVFILFFLLFLLLIFILFYRKYKLYKIFWPAGFMIHVFLFLTGAGITADSSGVFNPINFARTKADSFILKVIDEPVISKGTIRFEAKVLKSIRGKNILNSSGNLLTLLRQDETIKPELRYGDLLLVPAKFSEIKAPYNPGEFDYKRYLNNRKIYYQAFFNERDIKLLKRNSGNPIINYALNLRVRCVERINKSIDNKDAAALKSRRLILTPEQCMCFLFQECMSELYFWY